MPSNKYQQIFKQHHASVPPKDTYYQELLSSKVMDDRGLFDPKGNRLALYEGDYARLGRYVKSELKKDIAQLSNQELLEAIKKNNSRVIKYFSEEQLPSYALDIDEFNRTGEVVTQAGTKAKRENYQNCIVYHEGQFYMHPKVRAVPGSMIHTGISHTSFAAGKRAPFAGSITHDGEGWILENASGHYRPHAYQLRQALVFLKQAGLDLSKLRIKMWIPKYRADKEEEETFDEIVEGAEAFLARTTQSLEITTEKTENWLASQALKGAPSASSSNPAGQPSDDASDEDSDKRPPGHSKSS